MSKFELQPDALSGIRSKAQGVADDLGNCSKRLDRQIKRLNNQRGFGIETVMESIDKMVTETSDCAQAATDLAAFISELHRLVVRNEIKAYQLLAETPVAKSRTDAQVAWSAGTAAAGAVAGNGGGDSSEALYGKRWPSADGQVEAYIGRFATEAERDSLSFEAAALGVRRKTEYGDISLEAYADVAAVSAAASASFLQSGGKHEYEKGKDGKSESDSSLEFTIAQAGAELSASAVKSGFAVESGAAGIEGEVNLLTAGAKAGLNAGLSDQGFNFYAEAGAMASLASGSLEATQKNFFGLVEVTSAVTGHAGSAGGTFKAGIKENKAVFKAEAAAVLGAGVEFSIGPSDSVVNTMGYLLKGDTISALSSLREGFADSVKDGAITGLLQWIG